MIKQVQEFLKSFKIKDKPVTTALLEDRARLVDEEFLEFRKAIADKNPEELTDAGLDLVWVTLAYLDIAGVDVNKGWEEITRANMSKEIGDKPGRTTRCGDITKPEGWVGPDHTGNHGQLRKARPPKVFNTFDAMVEAQLLKNKKSQDYQGSRYSQEDYFPHGMPSYHTLLVTKVNRIGSVMEQDPAKINNESLRDSTIDLIAYASMTSVHLKNKL